MIILKQVRNENNVITPIASTLLVGWLFFSCIERFEIAVPRVASNYIVEAILLDDPRFQKVVISKINDAGEKEIVFGGDALFERKDQPPIFLSQNGAGEFVASQFIELVAGDQYRLFIRLGDNETITSGWEIVPEKILIKSGEWRSTSSSIIDDSGIKVTRNGVEFLVGTDTLPEDEAFIRYAYETTHINEAPFAHPLCPPECRSCYIQTIPTNYLTISGTENARGKILDDQVIDFLPITRRFSFRLTMLVRQITLTKNGYIFYQSISDQQTLEGSIFDPPPSVIDGNLEIDRSTGAEVYGLFELGRLDEVPIDVYKSDIENQFLTYSDICNQVLEVGGNVPAECFACFDEPGAGPRPYYYE